MLKKPPAYILIAILFGALTLLVLLARLSIPIGRLSTDPREIFLTLGAAFSGPIGVIILCAFMFLGASINGSRVAITSTTAHLISLILVAIIYKEIVHKKIDQVIGIESRGFIFGGALAHALGCGFIPMRKPGKLPWSTISESYAMLPPSQSNTRRPARSNRQTSPISTSTFLCRWSTERSGAAMFAGDRPPVATWYKSG